MSELTSMEADVAVRAALQQTLPLGLQITICPTTSLVDDLGLDSLRFVDLALAIERQLGIEDFPMQDWYDEECRRGQEGFTVGSLVLTCQRCIEDREAQEPKID